MKKTNFALLILLVVCVTVAGAYATWNYTTSNNIDAINQTLSVSLAEKEVTTVDGGKLTVNGTMTAKIDNGGNYKAKLDLQGGPITVTYDATESTTPEVTEIAMTATITVSSCKYGTTEVITVKEGQNALHSNGAKSSWQITTTEILGCLEIADITLPTATDYDAFEAALAAAPIVITITISAN